MAAIFDRTKEVLGLRHHDTSNLTITTNISFPYLTYGKSFMPAANNEKFPHGLPGCCTVTRGFSDLGHSALADECILADV